MSLDPYSDPVLTDEVQASITLQTESEAFVDLVEPYIEEATQLVQKLLDGVYEHELGTGEEFLSSYFVVMKAATTACLEMRANLKLTPKTLDWLLQQDRRAIMEQAITRYLEKNQLEVDSTTRELLTIVGAEFEEMYRQQQRDINKAWNEAGTLISSVIATSRSGLAAATAIEQLRRQ